MNSKRTTVLVTIVGGTLASAAMDLVQYSIAAAFERGRASDERDEEVEAIESVVRLIGTLVPGLARPGRAHLTARGLHYSFGSAFAWAYVVAVRRAPLLALGNGLAFGAALFLVSDRVLIPAFRLGRAWDRYSRSERFNALASHLAYGVVLETVRERFDRAASNDV